uniref:Uncharacterized protein n=2 Tax=Cacopsylla melanoneura TaxID=428564 RepID=A0A8D8TL60_9HEMI
MMVDGTNQLPKCSSHNTSNHEELNIVLNTRFSSNPEDNTLLRRRRSEIYRKKKLKCMELLREQLKRTLDKEDEFKENVQRFRDNSRPSLCRCLLPIFIFLLAVISSGLAFIFGFYMGLSYASIHTQCSSPLAMLYTPCNITVLNCSRLCILLDP